MSTEGIKKDSVKRTVPTDVIGKKVRVMRNATIAFTVLALAVGTMLLTVGVTLLMASNIGLESLTRIPIPWDSIVGLAVLFVAVMSARTYTAMMHKELLVERHIAFSK